VHTSCGDIYVNNCLLKLSLFSVHLIVIQPISLLVCLSWYLNALLLLLLFVWLTVHHICVHLTSKDLLSIIGIINNCVLNLSLSLSLRLSVCVSLSVCLSVCLSVSLLLYTLLLFEQCTDAISYHLLYV